MSKYFTEDHEWVVVEGEMATVGITDHAQDQLGDIVFVELPEVDEEYGKGDDISVVESVKAAGDVHNPVSGTVVEVNETLEDEPATVNTSPEGDGWIYIAFFVIFLCVHPNARRNGKKLFWYRN